MEVAEVNVQEVVNMVSAFKKRKKFAKYNTSPELYTQMHLQSLSKTKE